jgi:hypothetical protein
MKTIASTILAVLLFTFHDGRGMDPKNYDKMKLAVTPKKVVRNFLKWYEDNRERLDKFDLVSGKARDMAKAYRVNFRETEKYLTELKKSGFLSDQYINTLRRYFETADANFEKYPQYDGPALGFGIDLVLQAHDYGEILNHLKKAKYLEKPVNANSTKVYVRFPTVIMLLKLTRTGERWLIDSLDYV